MPHISRRHFLKAGVAVGAIAGLHGTPLFAERAWATDWVTLGKSGVKVTRLAFGTGSKNGEVQQRLGQKEFTRLVRYAYERGIRFFETAESYGAAARQLQIDDQGDHRRRFEPAEEARRIAQEKRHRVLRHHAASLAAHGNLGQRH
jgi:hypothetical protein